MPKLPVSWQNYDIIQRSDRVNPESVYAKTSPTPAISALLFSSGKYEKMFLL